MPSCWGPDCSIFPQKIKNCNILELPSDEREINKELAPTNYIYAATIERFRQPKKPRNAYVYRFEIPYKFELIRFLAITMRGHILQDCSNDTKFAYLRLVKEGI